MLSIIHNVVHAAHDVYPEEFGDSVTLIGNNDLVREYVSRTGILRLREDLDAGTFSLMVRRLTGGTDFHLNGFDASEANRSRTESLAEYLRFLPDQILRHALSLAVLAFFEAQEGLTFRNHAALLAQFCIPVDQAAA